MKLTELKNNKVVVARHENGDPAIGYLDIENKKLVIPEVDASKKLTLQPQWENNEELHCILMDGANDITLEIGNGYNKIDDDAFYGCSGFTGDLVIPDSVTSIGEEAFVSCSGFDGTLNIPGSVTNIGDYAFYLCSGFTGDLVIPDSVTYIGKEAFVGCKGFTDKLIIPKNVKEIGDYAFGWCDNFEEVYTLGDDCTISEKTFHDCKRLGTAFISRYANSGLFDYFDKCGININYFCDSLGKDVKIDMEH